MRTSEPRVAFFTLYFKTKPWRRIAAPAPAVGRGQWAVDVDRNWRVTFTFNGRDVDDVNYEDYH
jgi:plasmid maintenance system killer protein